MNKLEQWKKNKVNGLSVYKEAIKICGFELVMQDAAHLKKTLSLTDEESFELVQDCYFHILATWDAHHTNRLDWFKKLPQ